MNHCTRTFVTTTPWNLQQRMKTDSHYYQALPAPPLDCLPHHPPKIPSDHFGFNPSWGGGWQFRMAVIRVPLLCLALLPSPSTDEEAAGWPLQICIPDGLELPGRCLRRGPGAFLLPAALWCLCRTMAALPVQSNLPGTLSVCSGLTETLFLFQLDPGVGGAGGPRSGRGRWEEVQFFHSALTSGGIYKHSQWPFMVADLPLG